MRYTLTLLVSGYPDVQSAMAAILLEADEIIVKPFEATRLKPTARSDKEHDSRILQVTLFGTLQRNLSALDFSLRLPDVMTIADEVDSQLTQAMASCTNVAGTLAAA